MEFVHFPIEVGYDKMRVVSLHSVFDASNDPPAAPPGPRRILELGEQTDLPPRRLEAAPGDLTRHRRLAFEHLITGRPHVNLLEWRLRSPGIPLTDPDVRLSSIRLLGGSPDVFQE